MSTYVIVRPGDRGHTADDKDAHLVVEVDEWAKVLLKEKNTYDFSSVHTTFNAAHNRRNELNGIDDRVSEEKLATVEQLEIATETPTGVQWLGEKAAS